MALDLAPYFRELVRRYRIPPRYLELEVSESVWIACPEEARETGAALREAGFRLALYTDQGQLVRSWESAAQAEELSGLAPGRYLLELNGDADARRPIELEDTAGIQVIRVPLLSFPCLPPLWDFSARLCIFEIVLKNIRPLHGMILSRGDWV